MPEMRTNRDLYCFFADLVKQRAECRLTLQEYLANLRRLCHQHRQLDALPLANFAELLQAAFEPAPSSAESAASASHDYLAWEARITEQILDLGEMKEAGTLANEHRYLGLDAPRGGRWYNFDPCTYLECAAEGTFGGWQHGDDTGRCYVPGPVAVLDASGAMTSMDPRDLDETVVELAEISWGMFVDFLDAGQSYE